jgi:hypothetical protein
MFVLGLVTFCAYPSTSWSGTVLQDLATSMKPGTWAKLNSNGFSSSLLENGCIGNILGYADSAMWDPVTRTFFHYGSPHCGGALINAGKLIKYSEPTNTWTSCQGIDPNCATNMPPHLGSHAYDLNALDPSSSTWYRRETGPVSGSNRVFRYNLATNGPWMDIAPVNIEYGTYGAMAWFPELYGAGGLVLAQGGYGEIHFWNKSTNRWAKHPTNLPMGNYQNFAEYNPVHKVVVAGGGSPANPKYPDSTKAFYKIDANAKVTRMKDAPIDLGVHSTVFTVDPVTGDYIVLAKGKRLFKYDVILDTWSSLPYPAILDPAQIDDTIISAIVATPVSNYGVIMFIKYSTKGSGVFLYRHAAGTGTPVAPPPVDTTAPSVPSGVVTAAVSGSQITLSWNPSGDDVAGYRVYRNGVQIATTNTTSYSDSGLAASTTYGYTVAGYDEAGNVSAQSAVASATTSLAPSSTPITSDFQTKCAQPGVISCYGFDDSLAVRNYPLSGEPLKYTWGTGSVCDSAGLGKRYAITRERSSAEGNALANVENGICYYPTIDTSIKRTGAGSLKIDFPSNSGGTTGGYFTVPFKGLDLPRASVGPNSSLGSELWFQWHQRVDANMLNQDFGDPYSTGWKQIILVGDPPGATGDFAYNVVVNNGGLRGVAQFYYRVPFGSGLVSPPGEVQNKSGISATYPNGCSYGFQAGATSGFSSNRFYTQPPCTRYQADVWHEYTLHVKIVGASGAASSLIELYIDGVLVSQDPAATIYWANGTGTGGYGQFYLDPQMTGKNSIPAHPPGRTWFDDVVISTRPIAMSKGGSAISPPIAPSILTLK